MNRKLTLLTVVLVTVVVGAAVAEAASSPTVTTAPASSITTSSAVLNGTVNPNGSATSYTFEWGLTTAFGLSSAPKAAGSGTTAVAVSHKITGLIPGTYYYFRVDAVNKYGTTVSSARRFRTAGNPPPSVATGPSQVLSPNSATVTGVINPHGATTTYYFQYGTAGATGITYTGQSISASVAASGTPQTVSATLSPLPAGTWIHYRLVAVHGRSAPQYGADAAFLTFPKPRPVPRVKARTRPRHARHRPYVFTTSGRVIGPSWIPRSDSCFQNATVRFMLGKRRVAFGLATVQPDCTFSLRTVFHRLPGHGGPHRRVTLRVLIHFRGNGYLAPANAKAERVTLG